jgi:hypothetical protein
LNTVKTNYPELVSNLLKRKIMKTLNFKKTNDVFSKFTLSSIEMIKVRGGGVEDIPVLKPSSPPPVKI